MQLEHELLWQALNAKPVFPAASWVPGAHWCSVSGAEFIREVLG